MAMGHESSPAQHPTLPAAVGQGGVRPFRVSGWLAAVGTVVIGLAAGAVAVLWQAWATVLTSPGLIVLPWGAVLGSLVVFGAAVSWGLYAARRWVPGLLGLCAFAVLAATSLGGHDTLLAPLDTRYFAVAPGAVWSAIVVTVGTIVATLVALVIVAAFVPAAPRRR